MTEEVRMRVFLAVELERAVRDALAELIDGLRQARLSGLRFVKPDGVHLTLKFLGEVPESRLQAISSGVAQAVRGLEPFDLVIGDMGVFPNRREPRVLWVGLEGNLPQVLELHQRLEDVLEPMGFARDRRPFRPHLTLARLRERASTADRQSVAKSLIRSDAAQGTSIAVEAVSLMRSIFLPAGAEYRRLTRIPLRNGVP